MTKTFWLSFADPDRPPGQQFLGVCLVDVDDADALLAKADLLQRFPQHRAGAEWIAAATRKAHVLGINPGGQVMSAELAPDEPLLARAPRNRLLSRDELAVRGLIDDDKTLRH